MIIHGEIPYVFEVILLNQTRHHNVGI